MPDKQLKILAITSELPWPLNSGGHLRTFHLMRELSKETDLRLIVPVDISKDASLESLANQGVNVVPVLGCVRRKAREFATIGSSIGKREPYIFFGRHYWKQVARELKKQIRIDPPDLVYFDHIDSFSYRNEIADLPFVVDMHNVYSAISKRLAEESNNPIKSLYLRHETELLQKFEKRLALQSNAVFAVSDIEQQHFKTLGAKSVFTIPNGVDCQTYTPKSVTQTTPTEPEILFIGDLSWAPNVSAAIFLANQTIPKVREKLPHAKLTIVGRNPVPEVMALKERNGVSVIPNAPEIVSYYHRSTVLAVPLQSGGGTRLKILEAFAAGLPVISTPVGCEGLSVEHEKHLIVSGIEHFPEDLISALSTKDKLESLSQAGKKLASDVYDWKSIGRNLVQSINEICS